MTGAPVAANAIRNGCPIFANGETTLSVVSAAVEGPEDEEEEEEMVVALAVVLVVGLLLLTEDLVVGERGRLTTSVVFLSLGTGGNFVSLLLSNGDFVDVCCVVVVVALLITVSL